MILLLDIYLLLIKCCKAVLGRVLLRGKGHPNKMIYIIPGLLRHIGDQVTWCYNIVTDLSRGPHYPSHYRYCSYNNTCIQCMTSQIWITLSMRNLLLFNLRQAQQNINRLYRSNPSTKTFK